MHVQHSSVQHIGVAQLLTHSNLLGCSQLVYHLQTTPRMICTIYGSQDDLNADDDFSCEVTVNTQSSGLWWKSPCSQSQSWSSEMIRKLKS